MDDKPAKTVVIKSVTSSTVWLGVAWAAISGLPDVLTTVTGWFGPATPEFTAQMVAVTMLIARLRSIIGPAMKGLIETMKEAERQRGE
jgi:hypothetical protein